MLLPAVSVLLRLTPPWEDGTGCAHCFPERPHTMEKASNATVSADFHPACRYTQALLLGRPRHQEFDAFLCRHSPMNSVHRAKIFAPFNALRGFDDTVRTQRRLAEFGRFADAPSPDLLFLREASREEGFLNPLPPDLEDQLP